MNEITFGHILGAANTWLLLFFLYIIIRDRNLIGGWIEVLDWTNCPSVNCHAMTSIYVSTGHNLFWVGMQGLVIA